MTGGLKLKIGTRSSPLALAQAQEVVTYLLAAHPHLIGHLEVVPMTTTGDKITDRSLVDIGGKSLFTKEIEEALLNNEVDIAVHSMKDVPTLMPEGLTISCVLPREDARDALIVRNGLRLDQLPEGAKLGTSSLRRKAQIAHLYPHLEVVPLRGNVGTRLGKMEGGEVDATILAQAGLIRLGLEGVASHIFDVDDFIPAVAQGAIGVQSRLGDMHVASFLAPINDFETHTCIKAERAFMKKLEGSCQTPLGAYAEVRGQALTLRGFRSEEDGSDMRKFFLEGVRDEAHSLGVRLADMILKGDA